MKLLILFCCFISMPSTVFSWVGIIGRNDTERAMLNIKDDECYDSSYKLGRIPVGETRRIPHICATLRCNRNLDMDITGCGVVAVMGCKILPGDLLLPYPECCFKIICDQDTENKI